MASPRHRPPTSGSWKPGQTGNPHGRPPGTHARDLARQHTEEAIARLVQALNEPRHAVQAAVALLDRGWGRPKEQVEQLNFNVAMGGIDGPPRCETIEEAEQFLAKRRAERGEPVNRRGETADEWMERRQRELDALGEPRKH
jgi:hypothetical protein